VEPYEQGKYNMTYLERERQVVDMLADRGIYTLLDAHQDLLSPNYCGHGMPQFYVDRIETEHFDHVPHFPIPVPIPGAEQNENANDTTDLTLPGHAFELAHTCKNVFFFMLYFSARVSKLFQALYDDKGGLLEGFEGVWREAAAAFKDVPSVLGFELINEPWYGDYISKPDLLMLPGRSERQNLVPFYRRLAKAIRERDPDHLLFFGKVPVNLVDGGFPKNPLHLPSDDPGSVYSIHPYCAPTDSPGAMPASVQRGFCKLTEEMHLKSAERDVHRMGDNVLPFITEFGAVGSSDEALMSLHPLLSSADHHMLSWAYWNYKNPWSEEGIYEGHNGTLQLNKVKCLSRTYPQAVAGQLLAFRYDPSTAAFDMVFVPNASISAPTIIFVNEAFHYPSGYTVDVTPSDGVTIEREDAHHVLIRVERAEGMSEQQRPVLRRPTPGPPSASEQAVREVIEEAAGSQQQQQQQQQEASTRGLPWFMDVSKLFDSMMRLVLGGHVPIGDDADAGAGAGDEIDQEMAEMRKVDGAVTVKVRRK